MVGTVVIKRVFNNNVAMVTSDDGSELIVIGRGLCFGRNLAHLEAIFARSVKGHRVKYNHAGSVIGGGNGLGIATLPVAQLEGELACGKLAAVELLAGDDARGGGIDRILVANMIPLVVVAPSTLQATASVPSSLSVTTALTGYTLPS